MEVENTAPPTGAQWRPVQSRLAGKRGSTTATEDNTLLPQLAASRLIVDSPVGSCSSELLEANAKRAAIAARSMQIRVSFSRWWNRNHPREYVCLQHRDDADHCGAGDGIEEYG